MCASTLRGAIRIQQGDLDERRRAGELGVEGDGEERETSVEIVTEEAPVGDHEAKGIAENAVKNVQGQFRAWRDALESRIESRFEGARQAVPWMVTHVVSAINKGRKDDEGCGRGGDRKGEASRCQGRSLENA